MPNDLHLKILGNEENQENLKTSKNYSLVLNLPSKMKIFSTLAKNS